ncbi:MAG: TonB-dependent receptor [Xanthomonadales bacterium]|nr:TonB-dependent receptor [Xanthomonadales bacterium]
MTHSLSYRGTLAAAIALLLCAAPTAFAANADADADAEATTGDDTPIHRTERVVVSAKGTAADVPDALATEVVLVEDAIAWPSDFQDLITRVPGVGATGQNGIVEAFSIRGSGANNVGILYAGMPLSAQRRAGVPVSFVEPALLGSITVTRGPAVVHYGPGALGGAVSVEPRWFALPYASASYANGGDEFVLAAGFGSDTFSVSAAHHRANDTQAPNGTPLHTQFERASAVLQYRQQFDDIELDAMLSPSRTDDIGKSNSRFPTRNTTYPHDDHTVGRVRVRHSNGFEASIQGHDQSLRTWNRRPGFADTFADVQSLDLGATVQQTFEVGDFVNNLGLEYLGRGNVDAFDASGTIGNRRYTLRDAREQSWSLFAISDWAVASNVALEFGARHSTIDQSQAGAQLDDGDTALTAGAVWTPNDAHRLSLNIASGYRFATLEERFFSGVTAQGEVLGNPDLGSEHSVGIDVGHSWTGGAWHSEVHLWRTDVDDLIQLTAVLPGVNGFENVSAAKLWGAEAILRWTPTDDIAVRSSVAVVRSDDEHTGNPLFGSPPVTAEVEAKYRFGDDWTAGARYMHRWTLDRPGFEEVARGAVDVVDAEVNYDLGGGLDVGIYAQNLFDENYFGTADALSALAPERSFGVRMTWQAH